MMIQSRIKQLFVSNTASLIGAGVLVALVISSFFFVNPFSIALIAAIFIGVLAFVKPVFGISLLVPSLFLEADMFSFQIYDALIQPYHIIAVILAARVAVDLVLKHRKWKRTPFDLPLLAYIGIHLVSTVFSQYQFQGVKTTILIILLSLIFVVVYQLEWTEEKFYQLIRYVLFWGALETLFGLYQVFSYAINAYTIIHVPTFVQIHSDILPFGRPYGTFVEPDWYGMTTAVFFLFSLVLVLSKKFQENKAVLICLTLLFLGANILSVTRATWIGIIVTLVLLVLFHKKLFNDRDDAPLLNFRFLSVAAIILLVSGLMLGLISPKVQQVIKERSLSVFDSRVIAAEPRTIIIRDALNHFTDHPIIGNGPGSYRLFGITPNVTEQFRDRYRLEPFIPNILVTILNDTGIIGLVIFFVLGYRFFIMHKQALTKANVNPNQRVILFSLFITIVGLFTTFLISTGFWFGITWFFVALSAISARLLMGEVTAYEKK